jgi:hypothetical protein
MRRRLPYEPEYLIQELTAWIEWRYAGSRRLLLLTSAPTSLPAAVERWMPSAVWRLAWQGNGTAVLYGLAPGDRPTKFFVVRHDAVTSATEGIFEHLPDGTWRLLEGDDLEPGPVGSQPAARRRSPRRARTDTKIARWSSQASRPASKQRSTPRY